MTDNENTETLETIPAKKKSTINPKLKKALIWGGTALGIIAAGLLLARTFEPEEEACDGSCPVEFEVIDDEIETEDTD